MIKLDVPHYYGTEKLDPYSSCVEACFKMILKYFLPDRDFTWQKLYKLTHHVKGKGTWWFAAYPALRRLGFEIREFGEIAMYRSVYRHGVNSMYKFYRKEIADFYIQKSNVKEVAKFIPQLLKSKIFYPRLPVLRCIEAYLPRGWLLMADVDFSKLFAKWYSVSHAVVVTGYDRKHVYINDPARRRGKNIRISKKNFIRTRPGLGAFRLKNS
jgi:hypothetical protein